MENNMNSKQIKSSFEIYKGAKFKNGNDAIIEIVRKVIVAEGML